MEDLSFLSDGVRMTTKNDHTGDTLMTKPASDAFRSGWDRIFGGASVVENTTVCETVDEGSIPRATPRASKTYDEDMPLPQFGVWLEQQKYKS